MWRALILAGMSTTAAMAEPDLFEAALIGDPPPALDVESTAEVIAPPAPAAPSSPDRVRLVYIPGPFSLVCPTSDEVARRVVGHLGRDPFGEPAKRVMTLLLDGDTEPTRARLELLGPSLEPLGSRLVEATQGCSDLVETAALQMAIALDPLAAARPADPAEAPADIADVAAAANPPEAPEAPVAPDAARRRRIVIVEEGPALLVGGDAHIANWLASDAPMLGFTIAAGAHSGMFSGRTELRLDFGTTSDDDDDALAALVSILPCAHVPLIDFGGEDGRFDATGCVTASAGFLPELTTGGGVAHYLGAGLRLGLDWHVDDASVVHFFAQSEVPLWRGVVVGSPTVSTAPLNVVVGVGFDIDDWE
jgi:hypothetical protein